MFDVAVALQRFSIVQIWLTGYPKMIIVRYNRALKNLRGVRKCTSPDMYLIESGVPPVLDVISRRRRKFLESKLRTPNVEKETLYLAHELCR